MIQGGRAPTPIRCCGRAAAKIGMKEKEMKFRFGMFGAVLLTALLASAQKVETDYDHQYDFSKLHTFTVKFGSVWNNPLQQQRAKEDITQQLQAKGWTPAPDDASADAVVVLHGATQQQKSLDTWYSGGGWGWGPGMANTTVNTVNVGTMLVDIFDAKTKKLVFRGTASDDISDKPEKNAKKIDKAVEKMFKDFPPKPKNG
jgi:alpha-L-arabinofuranosidase